MKISLKQRKLKDGSVNLAIEYYKGSEITPEGKRKHIREYENLKLYLYGEPKNASERKKNKETLALANEILTNRINANAKKRVLATLTTEGKFLSTGIVSLSLEIEKIEKAKSDNQEIQSKIELLKKEIENLYTDLDKNNTVIQQASYNVLQQLIKGVSSSKTQKVFKEYAEIFLK